MTRRSLFHAVILTLNGVKGKDPCISPLPASSRRPKPLVSGKILRVLAIAIALALSESAAHAQPPVSQTNQSSPTPTSAPSQSPGSPTAAPDQSSEPAPPPGKVLFSRSLDSDAETQPDAQPAATPNPAAPTSAPAQSDPLAVTDAERSALTLSLIHI